MNGTLFVVGTPIGNLEDITLRAARVLAEVDLVVAEDTRVTRKLLRHLDIDKPMTSVREQNATAAIPRIVERLLEGADVALVTDAGTPSVSDPGEQLVDAAASADIAVSPIPGASALASAISVAGFSGDGVRFIGFLPRKGKRRKDQVASIESEGSLVVIYEAPGRIGDTLGDLSELCGDRRGAVMRELTKLHEEIRRGTLSELAKYYAQQERVRGEITLVIEGADFNLEEVTPESLEELVRTELGRGRTAKDISKSLSSALGLPRREVYETALRIIKDQP